MIDWYTLFDSATNFGIFLFVILAFGFSVVMLNKRQVEKSVIYRGFFVLLHSIVSICILSLLLRPSYHSDLPINATLYIADNKHLPTELESNEYLYLKSETKLDSTYLARYQDQIIFQPEQILLKVPALTKLLIIGDGLLPSQLQLFNHLELSFQPNQKITGVIYPAWKTKLGIGDQLEFSAIFQTSDQSIYQAKLLNPAKQVEDEISVINGESFVLEALPKLAGTHLYQLVVSDQNQNIISEQSIPVEVKQPKAAKILMMQSAPSFESKQIQNWAGEMGAELLIRTRISKNKYMTRSTNLSQRLLPNPKSLLSEKILSQFDVLIVDAREIQFYNDQELETLAKAIENGLGMVIRADGSISSHKKSQLLGLLASFNVKPIKQNIRVDLVAHNQLDNQLVLADSVLLSTEPLFNIQQPVRHISPLIVTPQGHVAVAQKNLGLGKITLSVVKYSYQLRTSDQARAHSQLWSHIIKNTARPYRASKLSFKSEQSLLLQNHQTNICSENLAKAENKTDTQSTTSDHFGQKISAEITSLNLSGQSAPTKVNLLATKIIPNKLCAQYWPTKAGWHKIITSEIEDYFYVHSAEEWLASQQNISLNATQTRITTWNPTTSETNNLKTINDWYYWLLIVVCSSLIWIERKFWSNR